jgi:uncharacterized membrane protein YdjX (TVP38/TMEM64 family)
MHVLRHTRDSIAGRNKNTLKNRIYVWNNRRKLPRLWASSVPECGREEETSTVDAIKPLVVMTSAAIMQLSAPYMAFAAESAPEGTFDMILKTTEALGPLGGLFFVCAVVICECIPLFPTTPLSLASGILFGPQHGALYVLGGTTLASVISFTVSRGFGRPIAEKIISAELGASQDEGEGSLIQKKVQDIETVIEQGTFWQQAGSVLALRLTPVIPFSASNYLLGLTPLPVGPYLTGTIVGMSFWSVVYASLGGASRVVLSKGVDPDVLLGELLETTGNVTSKAGFAALLGAAIAGAIFFGKNKISVEKATQKAPSVPPKNQDWELSDEEPSPPIHGDPVATKMHYPAADTGFYGEKQ